MDKKSGSEKGSKKSTPNKVTSQDDAKKVISSHDSDKTVIASPAAHKDEAKTVVGDSDATIIASPPKSADPDATVMATQAPAGDATVIATQTPAADSDATAISTPMFEKSTRVGGSDDDTDVADASVHDGQWFSPSQVAKRGSIMDEPINGRFVLEKMLGKGGMGSVYKAKDLRKVEARDRNPWLAVKVLNDDFKAHPAAFMSLQREARKTQNLTHPNIVRVHDFDRDGDTVYMTMELLDGGDFSDILRDHPDGLDFDDAESVVRDCGLALAEAHSQNIVHSDFKPGNVFYTKDKVAKVFDFGIARAAKVDTEDGEDDGKDKTVFDAGSLGALTPAYASLEMLLGEEPTKSDDVYALGILAYEAYTGKHPYGRKPANKALDAGLKVAPIDGLPRKQVKAITKALAIEQKDRYQTVDAFLDDFLPERKTKPKGLLLAVAVGLMVTAGFFILDELQRAEKEAELAEFERQKALQEEELRIQGLALEVQKEVQLVIDELNSLSNQTKEELDRRLFPGNFSVEEQWRTDMEVQLAALQEIYKDKTGFDALRKKYASSDFFVHVEEGETKASGNTESISEWVKAYRQRVANAYINAAEDSITLYEFDAATSLLKLAREYDPTSIRVGEVQQILLTTVLTVKEEEAKKRAEIAAERRLQELEAIETSYKSTSWSLSQNVAGCRSNLDEKKYVGSFTYDMKQLKTKIESFKSTFPQVPDRVASDVNRYMSSLRDCIQLFGFSVPDKAKIKLAEAKKLFPTHASTFSNVAINPYDACKKSFAGKGKRYFCQDRFYKEGKDRGPQMVVIPKDVGVPMLAMSRYEVSEAEFNKFCTVSGSCQASVVDGRLPAVNRPKSEIDAYLSWLSTETGFNYSLPTKKQWLHAANAQGSSLDPDRNCSLDVRGIVKGEQLLPVSNGAPNKWGVVNHVGNAQELVINAGSVLAVGGSRLDDMNSCTLETEKNFNAEDRVTGFRVMREIL